MIKAACEMKMGDELSSEALQAADDLYHMRIPASWCKLAGSTGPPPTYSLPSWLLDLQARSQHYERILAYVCFFNINFKIVVVLH